MMIKLAKQQRAALKSYFVPNPSAVPSLTSVFITYR